MAKHNCEKCPIRAKYDKSPKSLLGRFWRWHINFCPGWKKYMGSLGEQQREAFRIRYALKK
ncbi:MAG: hypothetical protein LUD02_03620 [Tannerellaceae bacterium]|nr:hypothetical protein [Tannerellaceae bacterium]